MGRRRRVHHSRLPAPRKPMSKWFSTGSPVREGVIDLPRISLAPTFDPQPYGLQVAGQVGQSRSRKIGVVSPTTLLLDPFDVSFESEERADGGLVTYSID